MLRCDLPSAEALGELDAGLRGFQHPAADHDLLWNVSNALRVRRLIPCVQDERRRAIAEKALDDFELHAVQRIPTLRTQVIHNDFNPHNILVAEESSTIRITGIIDFWRYHSRAFGQRCLDGDCVPGLRGAFAV